MPHYYYGAHLEKIFNEYYMGSPVTNKNYWELYTPQKEIIKEFPLTDEGWLEALDYETKLIKPVYNTDPLCLNEHCGGRISLKVLSEAGKKAKELGVGVHGLPKQQRIENTRKAGQKCYELGIGAHGLSKEELSKRSKKAAKITNSQVWECTITRYRSGPVPLSCYQKKRGIDTKNRIRIL